MTQSNLILHLIAFSFTLWLGFYLIARDIRNIRLWLSGLVLISYAIGVSIHTIGHYAPSVDLAIALDRWQQVFTLLPALFWALLLIQLLRRDGLATLLTRHMTAMSVILVTTILYALSIGLIIFPAGEAMRMTAVLVLSLILFTMGVAIAWIDATEKEESFWFPFIRSLDYSAFTALLFGGQVVLVMVLGPGVQYALVILLITTITAALLIQNFANPVQAFVDGIAFFNAPQLRRARAELREAAEEAPRANNNALNLEELDPPEFSRLTRRALSQMGNLPKLANSPLIRLPIVEERLADRETQQSTLVRAAELKLILHESIERLKPPTANGAYGTSDEWRHFNVLYFPYVLGLKPYRRRFQADELDTAVQPVIDWFRSQVPERTLYNWQNKAAQLIAQDLRERSHQPN